MRRKRQGRKLSTVTIHGREDAMQTAHYFACSVLLLFCTCPMLVKGDALSDLAAVQEAFFQWHLEQQPLYSTEVGESKYNDRLADLDIAVFDTQRDAVQQFINTAKSIDRNELDQQHQYSYDVFLDTLNTFVNNHRWRYYAALNPINFLDSFYLSLDTYVSMTPFVTKKDYENFIARLEAWPRQINQMKDRMDKSIEMGTTYHNVSMAAVPGQISELINTDPQQNVLYSPFNSTLDSLDISQDEKDVLRSRAQTALQSMWTALGSLKTYVETTYMRNTRTTYGVWGLPSGRDYYRACLQWHLSVNTTPVEVHRTGEREVERITQLMRQVMKKQGFNGTIREYFNQLKEDPQFGFSSKEAILSRYKEIVFDRIQPKLPSLFKDIPPGNLKIKPLNYDGPYGMYQPGSEDGSRPGIYYVNIMRPNETKSFTMVSLSLHEALPGHHMQFVYQLATDLPKFHKFIDYYSGYAAPYFFPMYTAYTEGWALYAEYLGVEMGIYENDYELMGRYSDEIFRACRLVVDTGLHFFQWTRDKAIQYLSERTAMSQSEVEIEIDRYITWPGQACAYKTGELDIKELRRNATRDLGSKFDIHEFHSLLLKNGPVPLRVMDTIIKDYVTNKTATGAASCLQCQSTNTMGKYLYLLLPSLLWLLHCYS